MVRVSKLVFGCVVAPAAGVSLLPSRAGAGAPPAFTNQGCSALVNRGTHFTVDVDVGTPPQTFSVVADTGSNALIVPSCVCHKSGSCPSSDRCFAGSNRSSTFKVVTTKDYNGQEDPITMVLTFGSGQIQAVVATDQVSVGSVDTFMDDGLLLMTARQLNMQGPFEGILGLGLPHTDEKAPQQQEMLGTDRSGGAAGPSGIVPGSASKDVNAAMGGILQKILSRNREENKDNVSDPSTVADYEEELRRSWEHIADAAGVGPNNSTYADAARALNAIILKAAMEEAPQRAAPKGFLEQAGIDRFSMCFNAGASGVLRIGAPPLPGAVRHGSLGTQHWGLGFEGISIGTGDAAVRVPICDPSGMKPGQKTVCGGIPDSGTTLFMAPADHITAVLEGICDGWDRCVKNYTKFVEANEEANAAIREIYGTSPFAPMPLRKGDILQMLLTDCEEWMTEEQGLDELPPLILHMAGGNGTRQALPIPGRAYVMESTQPVLSAVKLYNTARNSTGGGNVLVNTSTSTSEAVGTKHVCGPAFGVMDYNTEANGPVWILGTSLFYEYVVGYDMGTQPPSISFSPQEETPCGDCSLVMSLAATSQSVVRRSASRRPIRMNGPPRWPTIDTTKPL